MLKIASAVWLYDKLDPSLGQDFRQLPGRLLRSHFWPIASIAGQKVCLVDGIQYLRHR